MSDDYILVTTLGCEGSSSHQQATRHIHWLAARHQCQPVRKVSWRETSGISNIQVPLVLCQQVRLRHPEQHYLVFLDNLFLNVEVAHCLPEIGFAVMGTTRKNASGVLNCLVEAKSANRSLVWNSVLAVIVHYCLCFLWQDNNAVIAITTAHSLHRPEDRTETLRHRPKPTSANAAITWPVFEGHATKWLRIPEAIDDYNHGMNGVDTASQLRGRVYLS